MHVRGLPLRLDVEVCEHDLDQVRVARDEQHRANVAEVHARAPEQAARETCVCEQRLRIELADDAVGRSAVVLAAVHGDGRHVAGEVEHSDR